MEDRAVPKKDKAVRQFVTYCSIALRQMQIVLMCYFAGLKDGFADRSVLWNAVGNFEILCNA